MPSRNLSCNAFAPLSRGQANIKALVFAAGMNPRRRAPEHTSSCHRLPLRRSAWPSRCCAPSTERVSFNQRRSRRPPSPTCSPAATCSASPRPAPARPPHSPCRCCSTWQANPRHRIAIATRALILAPTRELALQIEDSLRRLGGQQTAASSPSSAASAASCRCSGCAAGADIVVGTPGRICDLMATGELKLNEVSHFVLDEADRMLDLGFIRDIRRIVAALPAERQSALFSATMPAEVGKLAETLLRNPVRVDVARSAPAELPIEQHVHFVEHRRQAGAAGSAADRSGAVAGHRLHPHEARRRPGRGIARDAAASG